jgi:enterochelin esterase-like enzyme
VKSESFQVPSGLLTSPRAVWVQSGQSRSVTECLIFLDGELYGDRVGAPDIVHCLQSEGRLPPVDCVYVSAVDAAARHADLTCNESFADFIAGDLMRWIERTVGHHERYTLCGLSLSGLSALFTALRHPAIFSGVLSQSPSAWWNDEWLANSLQEHDRAPGRFWLSVGNLERDENVSHPPTGLFQKTSQLDSCRRLAERLTGLCGELKFAEYFGGHDPQCWASELPDALAWLIGR